MNETAPKEHSPISATFKGRCPRCGVGKLYGGVLKLAPKCDSCDLDFAKYDQADGPAAFAMFAVAPFVMGPAVWLELTQHPPIWLHLILWTPWTLLLTFGSLRLIKSWLVGMQFKHMAEEDHLEE